MSTWPGVEVQSRDLEEDEGPLAGLEAFALSRQGILVELLFWAEDTTVETTWCIQGAASNLFLLEHQFSSEVIGSKAREINRTLVTWHLLPRNGEDGLKLLFWSAGRRQDECQCQWWREVGLEVEILHLWWPQMYQGIRKPSIRWGQGRTRLGRI